MENKNQFEARPQFTPDNITTLGADEVLVFGSNPLGRHNGGLARLAYERFGARMGLAVGLQGQSYAIPTAGLSVAEMRPFVDDFIAFARSHSDLFFYVPRIGCGHRGLTDSQVAPLFAEARALGNVCLPESFCRVLAARESGAAVKSGKTQLFHVYIIDQSGSMCGLGDSVVEGFNSSLDGIRADAAKYATSQQHYVSMVLFDTGDTEIRLNRVPLAEVRHMRHHEFRPGGGTPLYDAIGRTLTSMRDYVAGIDDAAVMVTIITDGYENSSRQFTGAQIDSMISSLKEQGWQFTLMGAGVDAEQIGLTISVTNTLSFSSTPEEYDRAMYRERRSRSGIMKKCHEMRDATVGMAPSAIKKAYSEMMDSVANEELHRKE